MKAVNKFKAKKKTNLEDKTAFISYSKIKLK